MCLDVSTDVVPKRNIRPSPKAGPGAKVLGAVVCGGGVLSGPWTHGTCELASRPAQACTSTHDSTPSAGSVTICTEASTYIASLGLCGD